MTDDLVAGTALYAICVNCDLQLATPDAAAAHRRETFEAARAETHLGGERRGHATRIVHPTAEEARQWKVRRIVEDALEDAYMRLDAAIDRDQVTYAEIHNELAIQDTCFGYSAWREDNYEDDDLDVDGVETVSVHPDQGELL